MNPDKPISLPEARKLFKQLKETVMNRNEVDEIVRKIRASAEQNRVGLAEIIGYEDFDAIVTKARSSLRKLCDRGDRSRFGPPD